MLYIAGQLGVAPDGSFARDIKGQAEQAWKNIQNVLAAAGMELEDLVKVNHYLTRKEDIAGYREVRARVLGDHKPASTLAGDLGAGARRGAGRGRGGRGEIAQRWPRASTGQISTSESPRTT